MGRYVAAALLAGLGGKSIDANNIKSILGSVGIEAESEKIDLVVKELAGKDLEELIAEGQTKLASMPAGGGGGAAPAAGGAAAPAADAAAKEGKKSLRKRVTMTWDSVSSIKLKVQYSKHYCVNG